MTYPSVHDPTHLYLMTATICGWRPILADATYADIILDSLSWLRRAARMRLFAFVVMPTHLHALVMPIDRSISELLQNFGSYTAHEIIKQLRSNNQTDLLAFFHKHRRDSSRIFSIWEDIQVENIYSKDFLREKLEYIHNNPNSKKWELVEDRADYRYSSACFYDLGKSPVIEVDDAREYL